MKPPWREREDIVDQVREENRREGTQSLGFYMVEPRKQLLHESGMVKKDI